jgi:hypothetical protein
MQCTFLWLESNRAMLESIARLVKGFGSCQSLFILRLCAGAELFLSCIPDTAQWHLRYQPWVLVHLAARPRAEPSGLHGNHRQRP